MAIECWIFLAFCPFVPFLVGCAHQPEPVPQDVPEFWLGLRHGIVIVFSFIGSLFTGIRIYNFPNSGGGLAISATVSAFLHPSKLKDFMCRQMGVCTVLHHHARV